MTKLLEWLISAACILSVYFAIILRQVKHETFEQYMFEIQLSPIFLLLSFGAYSATVVLYRTFTFNNCEEAARELMNEIKEAKTDLRSKGLVIN